MLRIFQVFEPTILQVHQKQHKNTVTKPTMSKAQIYFYIIIVQLSQATNPETKKKKKKKASPLVIAHAQCSETHI